MRIALGLEYDGQAFAGWQWQENRRTVQAEVERALSRIADRETRIVCAGRTDAGVHALEQVVHFDTDAQRSDYAWLMGGNSELPDDVRILWVRPMVENFHARYSAIARVYRYVVLNRRMRSALQRRQVTWCFQPLEIEPMREAARCLLGDLDFSSFRAQDCQSVSPRRIMHFIEIGRESDHVVIEVCANAFLHHMVRNIVGTLLEIGAGKKPPEWAEQVLHARDRRCAAATAPADGLYLAGIFYPPEFGLPRHPAFDRLPPDAARFTPSETE